MKISGSDLHLFRVFDSVVRNNGLSAAQMELSLSQPTISNHLTALEQRLGIKLCERGRRGFMLTEKGRLVHEIGMELLATLDAQAGRLKRLNGTLVGEVRLGVVDCVASDPACPLPDVWAAVAEKAPMIELVMTVMRPNDIGSGLARHTLDIGIGGFDIRLGGLDYAPLYQEDHALYCGRNDPLFAVPEAEITRAVSYRRPWVHRGYWNNRRQRSFQRIEADRIVYDIEAQLLAILSGAYVGLLPVHHAQYYVEKGRLRRLPVQDDDYSADIMLATRNGRMPRAVSFVRDLLLAGQ
ncbi:MAG: Transcriptional regulator, LysR family [Candidatus Tokpelaia hoelldobleri]|uniref:Transcriptional regulator, LysR family n=1 Tax=Candidatus Tokpelaia hoelldobleri TaxID=1902579 RepID=A0A1U9JSC6_9HYPH|nr:MAG: Transcriptional regulator, LysR family [Candidatus Tokpelaia hoelldoblerii]